MAKPLLIILIGIQGAGKSKFSKSVKIENSVILSADELKNAFETELSKYIRSDKSLIIDKTNLTKEKRRRILKNFIHTHDCIAVYFYKSLQTCLRNISKRRKELENHLVSSGLKRILAKDKSTKITEVLIYQASIDHKRMEAPSLSEGFDAIYVEDGDSCQLADARDTYAASLVILSR